MFEKFWWTWTGSNRRPLPCHGFGINHLQTGLTCFHRDTGSQFGRHLDPMTSSTLIGLHVETATNCVRTPRFLQPRGYSGCFWQCTCSSRAVVMAFHFPRPGRRIWFSYIGRSHPDSRPDCEAPRGRPDDSPCGDQDVKSNRHSEPPDVRQWRSPP